METSIPHALSVFVEQLSMPKELAYQYRAFGVGREKRQEILRKLVEHRLVDPAIPPEVSATIETFSAFIAAVVASMEQSDRVSRPENDFFRTQGWVYLPRLGPEAPEEAPRLN